MNSLFSTTSLFSKTSHFVSKSSFQTFSNYSPWNNGAFTTSVRNLGFVSTRFWIRSFSSSSPSSSRKSTRKSSASGPEMSEKDAFFVVRKGDVVGVYKNFSDCQAQVGSSICDPPVSVYKGYALPKDTEEYLVSRGLRNAVYSIRAADLKEDLFGALVPCPLQLPASSSGEIFNKDLLKRRSLNLLGSETEEAVGSMPYLAEPLRKQIKSDNYVETREESSPSHSCILEFDGASKGNPGQAGAGAVLRALDGSLICRLREGLGIATNNAAEYRAMILGLRYALKKGYTSIHVIGDSKLVCMQLQGLWKVKNQNMSVLYEEAKILKNKFLSFRINHVLRDLNSDADAQANLAVGLSDGQVQEVFEE